MKDKEPTEEDVKQWLLQQIASGAIPKKHCNKCGNTWLAPHGEDCPNCEVEENS